MNLLAMTRAGTEPLLGAWPLGDGNASLWIPALALAALFVLALIYAFAAPKKPKRDPDPPWEPPSSDGANTMRIAIIAIAFFLLVVSLILFAQADGHSHMSP
jgi:hypothetical protein